MWKRAKLDAPLDKQVRIGFSYELGETGLSVVEEAGFTRLHLEGGHVSAEPGAPQIPYLVAHVAVPVGAKVVGVRVVQQTGERLEGAHVVMPAQLPGLAELRFKPPQLRERFEEEREFQRSVVEEAGRSFVAPDLERYRTKAYYPASAVELVTERTLGPYRILAIRVNPVRYRPAEGALWVSRTCTVAVELAKPTRRAIPSQWAEAQLERWYDLAAAIVINPEDLALPQGFKAPAAGTPYLIVTNREMQAEFNRLAEWKTATGLAARVVTMEDILNRLYGDFSVGAGGAARDTQEVLRNFLKWARDAWKVAYLLIGGDTNVVPVREVAALSHYNWYTRTNTAKPEAYRCRYDGLRSQTNLHTKEHLAAATPLMAITSGRRIPYNPTASATNAGWHWATSDSYATRSATPTAYVVIRGPKSLIDDATGFYRIEAAHSIPTDLYYASLVSPQYNKAGRHDWDQQGTGLFGYYNEGGEPSGIDFMPDICVGRAPCASQAEAAALVDKFLKYERFEGVSEVATRRAIFAADYWGGPVLVGRAPVSAADAGENQYKLTSATVCRIRLRETPPQAVHLIAEMSSVDFRLVPFRMTASSTNPGWYFAEGPHTLSPSRIKILGMEIPIPSPYIVVRGPEGTLSPLSYWVDNAGPDGALKEKEQVRALFRGRAPKVDHHRRLYRDFASVPAAAPGESVLTAMLTTSGLVGHLNAGALFCSLSGHGWWGGCCFMGLGEAKALRNGLDLPVVFADSCSTGSFDQNDAFGEELLLNPGGGALAYVGNTRWSWIGMGDDVERLFWTKLFGLSGVAMPVGVAFDARVQALTTPGWKMLWKWSCLALNLLGDPSIRPWVGVPQRLNVKAPLTSTINSTVVIGVTNANGAPVSGAKVCLYQRGKLMRTAYTADNGTVLVSVAGAGRGALTVTATRPGWVPSQRVTQLV